MSTLILARSGMPETTRFARRSRVLVFTERKIYSATLLDDYDGIGPVWASIEDAHSGQARATVFPARRIVKVELHP